MRLYTQINPSRDLAPARFAKIIDRKYMRGMEVLIKHLRRASLNGRRADRGNGRRS